MKLTVKYCQFLSVIVFTVISGRALGRNRKSSRPVLSANIKKRDALKKIPVPRKIVAHRKSYLIRLFRNFLRYRKSGNLIWTEI